MEKLVKFIRGIVCKAPLQPVPSRQPHNAFILQMPVELFYCISDHLSGPDHVSLSMTCKSLEFVLGHTRKAKLSEEHSDVVLSRLEQDAATTHFLCTRCRRLHEAQPSFVRKPCTSRWSFMNIPCLNMGFAPISTSSFSIGYHLVRQVMNRHFYGAPAGLPIETLDVSVRHNVFTLPTHPQWKSKFIASIIRDELVLCGTHKLSTPTYSMEPFWDYVNEHRLNICSHLKTHGRYSELHHIGTGCCFLCPSDYVSSINIIAKGRIHLTINTYHLLGDGRHHMDWKWRALVGAPERTSEEPAHQDVASRDFIKYPSGYIRDLWSSNSRFSID